MKSLFNFIIQIPAIIFFLSQTSFAQSASFKGGSGKYTKLVWADEFNYTGIPNRYKWNYENGYIRNKELQFYTIARKENAFVHNGYLTIATKNDSLRIANKVYPITSASLITKNKKEWTYGRFEVRAKIPSSLGTWPAIWMLGSNIETAGWPACGEIDILEHVGYIPDTVHFNVHTEKYNHVKKTNKGVKIYYPSPYKDFHVYAIEWFKDHIDWFMDDAKVFTYKNDGEGASAWPFDKPQYLILNLAFGGSWGGSKGIDISLLPQELLIDYVRVYQ
ncbi:MAG: glycoside hydrolase family 16 protein [Ginsengibacter sp.]